MPSPCHEQDTLLILHTQMLSSFHRSTENLSKIRICESQRRLCGFISTYLYSNVFRYFGGTKESSKLVRVNMAAKLSLLLKVAAGHGAHRKQASQFAIRYVVYKFSSATTSAVL